MDGLRARARARIQADGLGRGLGKALRWRFVHGIGSARRGIGARLIGPQSPVDPTPMEGALRWLAARENFTIVQIGAYVGDSSNDPLYCFLREALPGHPDRRAVLVEPVGDYFTALQDAYRGLPNVELENVAIADEPGERDFYRLAPNTDLSDRGEDWQELTQLGSLRPERMTEVWERVEGHTGKQRFWHEHSSVERVQCLTLEQLLRRHGLEHVDLLQIDTEGYDYEILRTIDFSRLRPPLINYERILLGEDEPACRRMLTEAGYILLDWGLDTLAVLASRPDS